MQIFQKVKPPLPKPLSDWLLELPFADVKMRMQLKVKYRPKETIRISDKERQRRGTQPIEVQISSKTLAERLEPLREAHYLDSDRDPDKFYVFCNREAASEYIFQRYEGREDHQRRLEAHKQRITEKTRDLREAQWKLQSLKEALDTAKNEFRETSLAAEKAANDISSLERRVRELKEEIGAPVPERSLGAAISLQFGADQVLGRAGIAEVVERERDSILKRYRGLPDHSELELTRRIILDVAWKN